MGIKVIFHGGLSKSGSTSIQTTLQKNKDRLKKMGVLVPESGIKFRSRHHYFFSYKGDDYMRLVDNLYDEASSSNCHTILMSEESLNKGNDIEKHKYMVDKFESVKFIFFLRRQDTLLESYYNQTIKVPWEKKRSITSSDSLLSYSDELHWLHYDKLLDSFAKIAGKNNVIAIPFEKAQLPKNISHFFLETICQLDVNNIDTTLRFDNTSIPYSSLGFAIEVNKVSMDFLSKPSFIRKGIHNYLRKNYKDYSPLVLSHYDRYKLMEKYEKGNMYVAKEYLYKSDSSLYLEPLPSKDKKIQHTQVSMAEIENFANNLRPFLQYIKDQKTCLDNNEELKEKTHNYIKFNNITSKNKIITEIALAGNIL